MLLGSRTFFLYRHWLLQSSLIFCFNDFFVPIETCFRWFLSLMHPVTYECFCNYLSYEINNAFFLIWRGVGRGSWEIYPKLEFSLFCEFFSANDWSMHLAADRLVITAQKCEVCELGCSKPRPEGCSHPCPRGACHPGSCPPCTKMVKYSCHCGLNPQLIRCNEWVEAVAAALPDSRNRLLSCKDQCPKRVIARVRTGRILLFRFSLRRLAYVQVLEADSEE